MHLPYSPQAYIALLAHYNAAIWPMQLVAAALVLVCVIAALRPISHSPHIIGCILALLWGFVAIAFYHMQLARLSFMAPVYAGTFLLQAVLIGWLMVWHSNAAYIRPHTSVRVMTGLLAAVGGIVIYPGVMLAIEDNWQAFRAPGITPGSLVLITTAMILMVSMPMRRRLALLALPIAYSIAACFKTWFLLGVPII